MVVNLDEEALLLQQRKKEIITPRLPVELIREIVEIAATQFQFTLFNLSLVCKEMHRWMVPIIFHTITLDWRKEKNRDFMIAIADKTFTLVNHFRNLHIVFYDGDESLANSLEHYSIIYLYCGYASMALSKCAQVERLVLSHWNPYHNPEVAEIETFCSLWDLRIAPTFRLYLYLHIPEMVPFAFAHLQHVTHFYYADVDFCTILGEKLSTILPRVTHLAFWQDVPEDIYQTLDPWLRRPSLKMLYVEYRSWKCSRFKPNGALRDAWKRIIAIDDERFFIGSGFQKDFECLTEAGKVVWDRVSESFRDWRITIGTRAWGSGIA